MHAPIISDFPEKFETRRLEIRCDTRNLRSARIAESAGFEPEARLRDASITPSG